VAARKHCCRMYREVESPPEHYHVYVIELAGSDGHRMDPRVVYVGQTSHSPQERFANHKQGHKASRHVQKRGLWLRWRLFDALNPLPGRAEAEAAEAELAARLRHLACTGCTVDTRSSLEAADSGHSARG
jgi:hypothetical protein